MRIYGEKAITAETGLPRWPRMNDQETIKGYSIPENYEKEDVIDTTNP
jgi:hypothetical protein